MVATPALPLWWAIQRMDRRMASDLKERWGLRVPAVVPGVLRVRR